MRKIVLACLLLSMPAVARADLNHELDLMDMQDAFELQQMGLDHNSLRMNRLEDEIYRLRMQLQQAPTLPTPAPATQFDPSTFRPTGKPFSFPPVKG